MALDVRDDLKARGMNRAGGTFFRDILPFFCYVPIAEVDGMSTTREGARFCGREFTREER